MSERLSRRDADELGASGARHTLRGRDPDPQPCVAPGADADSYAGDVLRAPTARLQEEREAREQVAGVRALSV